MAVGLRALGSYFLGCFKKKKKSPIKIFNSLKKFKISKFFKKKSSIKNFNSMKKFKISKIFKKKKGKFSKKALGLGALGSYFLGCFKKKKKSSIKIFNSFKKIQDFQIFSKKKKKSSKFSIP